MNTKSKLLRRGRPWIFVFLTTGLIFMVQLESQGTTFVHTGEIRTLNLDGSGIKDDVSIDRISFDIVGGVAYVEFDVLAFEFCDDLNGDGELTSFDSWINLYTSGGTLLQYNDDSPSGYADGSVGRLDSWMPAVLDPGSYFITIGQMWYSTTEAKQGYRLNDPLHTEIVGDHADWQMTMTSNLSSLYQGDFANIVVTSITNPSVPEPATVALLGIGLVGLAGAEIRRRRKKQRVCITKELQGTIRTVNQINRPLALTQQGCF